MAYQSTDSKKEEFRKYLEKSAVVESLTRVLVTLYEEPERPEKPIDFIRKELGAPSIADFEALKQENEDLKTKISRLQAQLGLPAHEE